MKLYTYQLALWRYINQINLPHVDTTVKSGDPMLAPPWAIVLNHKNNVATDKDYIDVYLPIMEQRYVANKAYFDKLVSGEHLALGCYCKPGNFCHRYLLIHFLISKYPNITYQGEIRPPGIPKENNDVRKRIENRINQPCT